MTILPFRRAPLPAVAVALAATMVPSLPAAASAEDGMDIAVTTGYLPAFGNALLAAGLQETLHGPGPWTLFVPTEAAFARLPPGVLADLLEPENRSRLRAILLGHLVAGRHYAAELGASTRLESLQGTTLVVAAGAGGLRVNGARVTGADVESRNGVIHFIDRVLMPPV